MRITTAQVFQIGSIVITFLGVVLSMIYDPSVVVKIAGATGIAWSGIGTVLTTPNAQTNSVAAHIEDPTVKTTMVQAVANLTGVERVRTNDKADPTLKALADSQSPINKKIEPPKGPANG